MEPQGNIHIYSLPTMVVCQRITCKHGKIVLSIPILQLTKVRRKIRSC